MPIIKSFDDALNYVNRLGLAGSGSIQARQDNLVDITDMLLRASGNKTWHRTHFESFPVMFKTHIDEHALGTFFVMNLHGKIVKLELANAIQPTRNPSRGRSCRRNPSKRSRRQGRST